MISGFRDLRSWLLPGRSWYSMGASFGSSGGAVPVALGSPLGYGFTGSSAVRSAVSSSGSSRGLLGEGPGTTAMLHSMQRPDDSETCRPDKGAQIAFGRISGSPRETGRPRVAKPGGIWFHEERRLSSFG